MKRIFALLLFVLAANAASAQQAAVRVNALALATGTLNAGIEVAVAERWSVVASGYWNPIATDNLRMKVLAGTVGVRRWRCEPYAGLFWGLHSTVARYRVGNGRNRYNGWTAGAGSYGSPRPSPVEDVLLRHYRRVVLAPAKLEVSFSYVF